MQDTVFVELKFWLLVLFSLVAPVLMVWLCLTVKALSRNTVLFLGLVLVAIAGFDFYLLKSLAQMALLTPSLADDVLFDSEVTVGLVRAAGAAGGHRHQCHLARTHRAPHRCAAALRARETGGLG